MSFPDGHDLPVRSEEAAGRRSQPGAHSPSSTLRRRYRESKDRRTDRSGSSRLPLLKLLAQSQRSHGHPGAAFGDWAHRGQLSLERRPPEAPQGQARRQRSHTGPRSLILGRSEREELMAPFPRLPTEFQRAARCPSTEGGSGRCSSASLELINWKGVLSVLGEAEG